MRHIGGLLKEILRSTRVVHPVLGGEVLRTAREFWPTLVDEELQVVNYSKGVLHVVLRSHARMAEATAFLSGDFRRRLNAHLEDAPGSPSLYVSKLVFHVKGTY